MGVISALGIRPEHVEVSAVAMDGWLPARVWVSEELGSETGDVKRPRGFYIIDRTEEVGFKPGEDLNVEKTIRLRRRIESVRIGFVA